MIKVYIIKSLKDNGFYIGICKDLNGRLKKHNNGEVKSTKNRRPLIFIYEENFEDYEFARKREKQIKSWYGGNTFRKLVAEAARSSNGRT